MTKIVINSSIIWHVPLTIALMHPGKWKAGCLQLLTWALAFVKLHLFAIAYCCKQNPKNAEECNACLKKKRNT